MNDVYKLVPPSFIYGSPSLCYFLVSRLALNPSPYPNGIIPCPRTFPPSRRGRRAGPDPPPPSGGTFGDQSVFRDLAVAKCKRAPPNANTPSSQKSVRFQFI